MGRARRAGLAALHAEIRGELKFPVGQREFTLSAIADRIEQRQDGSYAILDYKTGAARTEKQVRTGLAPQLTLEAAILRAGRFRKACRRFGVGDRLRHAERRRAGRQAERDQFQGRHARHASRPRAGAAQGIGGEIRERSGALSLARAPDVEDALRRLRPPRPRQGMVGDRRRARSESNERRRAPSRPTCRRVQVEAADPDVSAFVSANAGSGKTYVLAQRVINLLLRGVDPAKILCITFTKTAAANMANEVFKRLAGWTALDDAALDEQIRLSTGTQARRARPRAGAPPVRLRAGDAGRPEGADHPRLLHAAAASVPVRGQCRRALHRAGRGLDHATAR